MHCIADLSWDGTNLTANLGTNANTIQRLSTGKYQITFTNSMGSNAYAVAVEHSNALSTGAALIRAIPSKTASSINVEFYRRPDGAYDDPAWFSLLALDSL